MTDTSKTDDSLIKTETPSDVETTASETSQSFTHCLSHQWRGIKLFDLVCIVLMCAGMSWVYWYCVNNHVLGFTHDDGIYTIAAKSLAQGDGFWLLQIPGEGMPQVKYPILYPLILSIAWKINPSFPENLPLMNALTITFSIMGLGIMAGWFRFQKQFPLWLSVILIPVVASNFFFLFYTSAIMSEGPYFCFSIATLWFAEHALNKKDASDIRWKDILILCLLCTLTFHTRILGVTLITAIGVWMLLQRQFKWAFIYGSITAVFTVLPWGLYLWLTRPQDINAFNYSNVIAYSNYVNELLHNTHSDYWQRVLDGVGNLVYRLFEAMFNVFPHFFKVTSSIFPSLENNEMVGFTLFILTILGSYFLFGYYISQIVTYFNQLVRNSFKKPFTLPAVYLILYLGIIMFWSYDSQIGRFILMLSPVFWFYFFKPVIEQKKLNTYAKNTLISFFLILSLASAYKTVYSIHRFNELKLIDTNGELQKIWVDYSDAFAWIKENTPEGSVLASHNDAVFYLYTERPTYFLFSYSIDLMRKYNDENPIQQLWETVLANKVDYLILDPFLVDRLFTKPYNPAAVYLLANYSEYMTELYYSPNSRVRIFRINRPESDTK